MFGRFAREVHLYEQVQAPAGCLCGFIQLLDEHRAVDRMHDVETARLFRFVRLEMADQMPPDRKVRRLVHLLACFLDLVLAEVDLAGASGRAHVFSGEGLGDGDEGDGSGIAPHPAGGPRDPSADICQPGLEGSGVDHYFFSVVRIPFAVAAFGPEGASFRYVSNSVAAPARLPSFTSAMPSW